MKIFVLNCGSSSIKFQFIKTSTGTVLASGIVERIGEEIGLYTYKSEKYTEKDRKLSIKDHSVGLELIINDLLNEKHGVIKDVSEIDGVGHRIVHGGEFYSESVVIDNEVKNAIKKCCSLAPLHNPANLKGIEAIEKNMKNIPQVAVFDTAFHQTMPSKAYLYALPLEYYKDEKIRRYGFHGTSHKYVAMRAAKHVGKILEAMKIITCHIGNGASVTAIHNGKSIDTSMGFTPLEGIVMGTRSGDIDPAIPLYMINNMGKSAKEVENILNKKSGILGLSELSNDMREIERIVLEEDDQTVYNALEVYCYKIKKYIGSYIAAMNGVDVIIFTGGVGENMAVLREMVCRNLEHLGIEIDKKKNDTRVKDILEFQSNDSKVKLLKIPTNEELMIALETENLLK